ncbi:uncharacterized protein LOC117167796 isoform X1 [Belonocnema kinseyi]|uniref:uncharacterized protein LOC117167796 isoform X1 n=1 Tax=Belonocnema kinseyi TaxID=2817044 RepID=UPI00143DED0C|nr:uncharacterized protein LOC117167796 isoform X1 [Belonocnema kinseyi]
MDCCNYVQPYTGAGHFYQQHHFSYENMNAYAAYGAAPVSNAIEASVRYNRLPPAYPTDYVYNPKEARLRKAMREQSRELSRQTILQTAISSATGSATGTDPGGNGSGNMDMGVSSSGNFLNHPMACASPTAAASSLPGSPSINANRIISPWFPVGHGAATSHLKPILTPRAMAAHQRTLDQTKEVIRKQIECAASGAFSGPGYGDFVSHGPVTTNQNANQEGNDYCIMGEFPDGQKWHPYQNGTNAYHSRGAPLSKINNLHRNMQNSNHHPGHWAQFCGVPLPQNATIRGPRHLVFLQDQQNQHCAFNEEMQHPYGPNKIDISHRLHSSYPQSEHQQEKPSHSSPLHISQLQEEEKRIEEAPRWSGSTPTSGTSEHPISSNLVANSSRQESESYQKQDQESEQIEESPQPSQQYVERAEIKQKMSFKQPLPGFHQAFGSTEIGRFSRSEFFANMVGENSNLIPEAFLSTPGFPFAPKSQNVLGNSTLARGIKDEKMLQKMMAEDCLWLAPGIPASSISENASNYAALLDYSHRVTQEWLHPVSAQDLQIAYLDQSSAFLFHENDKENSKNNCISCKCGKLKSLNQESTSSSDLEGLDLRLSENSKTQKDGSDEDL